LLGLARISMTNSLHGAIAAALVVTAQAAALAQPAAPASAPRASSSAAASRATTYMSAFDGYRRFDDQKVQPWRDANDNVGRIGGWQAYARESADEASTSPPADHSQHKPAGQATPLAPAASTPGPAAAPVKAPPPAHPASVSHDGHKDHGGHSMHEKP
jgi:hypothetical protein